MGVMNSPEVLFWFSGIFFVYAVIMYFLDDPDIKKRKKIRRLFYGVVGIVFSLYYYFFKPYSWAYEPNKFGLPQLQYIFLLNLSFACIIAILLDMLYISTYEFKSIGKDGISIAEDDKAVAQNQRKAIVFLEQKVDAEYFVIQDMDEFMVSTKPEIEQYLELVDEEKANQLAKSWILKLLNKYIGAQNQELKAAIFDYADKEMIKKDYELRSSQYTEFLNGIDKKGYINQDNKVKILCLGFDYKFIDKRLIIVIEYKDEIVKREQHLIENLLNVFANRLYSFAEFVLEEMEQ